MNIEQLRLGQIEIRKTNYTEYPYEIIEWHKNSFYGKESEFIKEACSEFYYKENDSHFKIHENSFKTPEICIVIAWVQPTKEEPDIVTVGRRPFELDDVEYENYTEICKHVYKCYDGNKLD